ncbi:MAG TPA: galactokinase family protein [Gemmatimonadales bacterium]|nr:galactokinase family protein [Gemmatimonadales bacterium]
MTTSSPLRLATSLFTATYATRPTLAASAPGRVNLIGEHLDYNGGPVLPLAVRRRTAVVAAPAEGWWATSARGGSAGPFDPEAPPAGHWTDYLAGVVRTLRGGGAPLAGAQIAVASDVPAGAGLASSAALTLAAARVLARLSGRRLGAAGLAEVAHHAEHDEVGVRGGRMDQVIGAHARADTALLYESATGEMRHLPFRLPVHVLETGVTRALAAGALNERRAECEAAAVTLTGQGLLEGPLASLPPDRLGEAEVLLPAPLARRVRHVVTETARVHGAVASIESDDLAGLGRLLAEGHASLRLDFESSCAEADLLVETLLHHGAHGARLTGAGWGGAVLALLPAGREREILRRTRTVYEAAFGRPVVCWQTRPAGHARLEEIPD